MLYIEQILSKLPADGINEITNEIGIKEIQKGQTLVKIGSICHELFFIEKGLLRTYCLRADGKEINLEFTMENQFITSIDSFYNNNKSNIAVESLEDSRVFYLSREKLDYFYIKYPSLNEIGRKITEQNFVRREKWHINKFSMDAAERYNQLITTFPEFVQRVPLTHLASYLGMSKEHLSRIRANG